MKILRKCSEWLTLWSEVAIWGREGGRGDKEKGLTLFYSRYLRNGCHFFFLSFSLPSFLSSSSHPIPPPETVYCLFLLKSLEE